MSHAYTEDQLVEQPAIRLRGRRGQTQNLNISHCFRADGKENFRMFASDLGTKGDRDIDLADGVETASRVNVVCLSPGYSAFVGFSMLPSDMGATEGVRIVAPISDRRLTGDRKGSGCK